MTRPVAGELATAAVEIIAELDRFEPELRRKLTAAVQSASNEAEKEFRKAGNKSGAAFADAVAKSAGSATASDNRYERMGRIAGGQFADGFGNDATRGLKADGQQAGKAFSDSTAKAVRQSVSSVAAARAQVAGLEEAFIRAGDAQVDAAGRARVAEQKLAEVRANEKAAVSALFDAEENYARALRSSSTSSRAATAASNALAEARKSLASAADDAAFAAAGDRDGNAFGDALQKAASKKAAQAGDDSGGFFSRAFESAAGKSIGAGLFKGLAAGAVGLLAALSPVSTLLGGATAAVVALAGALVQASGAAVAAGGVLGSLGLAAVAVKVGTSGLADAFKAQSAALTELAQTGTVSEASQKKLAEALKLLAPEARQVVAAVGAQDAAWRALKQTVQGQLFAGVATSIRQLANTFLPILSQQLTVTGGLLNITGRGLASFLTAPANAARINDILSRLNGILATLLPIVQPLINGFLILFQASLPFAQKLADAIAKVGTSFGTWAAGIVQSGAFADFMNGAFKAASLLLGIIGKLGGILSSVFTAGATSGVGLLSLIENLLGKFDAFLKSAEGQSDLASFFGLINSAGSILLDTFTALRPVFAGLATIFTALQGPIAQLGVALQPIIGQLALTLGDALKTLAPILAGLVTALTPLVGGLLGGLVTIFQSLFTAITPLFPVIVQIVTALVAGLLPVLPQLVLVITNSIDNFGLLITTLLPLVPSLLALIPPAAQLSLAFAQMITALLPLINLFAQLAITNITRLLPAIIFIINSVVFLTTTLANLATKVAAVIRVVIDFVVNVISNFQNLRAQGAGIISALIAAVVAAFRSLPPNVLAFIKSMISQALSAFTGFISSASTAAGKVASGIIKAITSGLSGLGSVFAAPFNSAKSAVSSALQSILSTVEGFVSKISGAIGKISSAISHIPGLPSINIPGFARGGLQRTPTLATLAEDGPEVVIPLNKPRRRDQLLDQYFGGWQGQQAWNGGPGYGGSSKVTQVHIPITAPYAGAEELARYIGEELDRRYGRRIGIETSRGAV